MFSLKRDWKFRVKIDTQRGECVCVVGNCTELGNWMIKNAVLLTKEICSRDEDEIWSAVVSVPDGIEVEYRYCVCVIVEPDGEGERCLTRQIIVRRWETGFSPRLIRKDAFYNTDNTETSATLVPDIFGHYGNSNRIENGWLTTETIIQLKLLNNPIFLWKKRYQGRKIHIKVTPVRLDNVMQEACTSADSLDESMDTTDFKETFDNWPITEVAVMNEDEWDFKSQGQFGRRYNEGDFITFQIQVMFPESVAYMIDLYACHSRSVIDDIPTHIGFCYILPSVMKQSEGQTIAPITSTRHRPIGQLTVEYVLIKPIDGFDCDMKISYARYWKHTWQGLDVGHRGAGTSFKFETKGCANVRENTIASLTYAASHGADFVEFDVQLSKDLVPVIYHDFHVCIAMKRKKQIDEHDMLELPVKDLTLEQLQRLKVYHLEEGKNQNPRFFDDELEDHQPFPTLQHALQILDPHVGFNIEIKWTMLLKDGTYELNHPFDLNMYLDIVLKTALQYGGNRKIVFSCFHPDICSMIRLKQNKYPVMFLTQGVTKKYPDYHDPRTQSIPMAVHYALSAGLLGINVHTEDILRDVSQVQLVKKVGLVMFCWGEDNNDVSTIKHLKALGLNAVIYDRIDEYSSKEVKESIFLVESREAEGLLQVATKEKCEEEAAVDMRTLKLGLLTPSSTSVSQNV